MSEQLTNADLCASILELKLWGLYADLDCGFYYVRNAQHDTFRSTKADTRLNAWRKFIDKELDGFICAQVFDAVKQGE